MNLANGRTNAATENEFFKFDMISLFVSLWAHYSLFFGTEQICAVAAAAAASAADVHSKWSRKRLTIKKELVLWHSMFGLRASERVRWMCFFPLLVFFFCTFSRLSSGRCQCGRLVAELLRRPAFPFIVRLETQLCRAWCNWFFALTIGSFCRSDFVCAALYARGTTPYAVQSSYRLFECISFACTANTHSAIEFTRHLCIFRCLQLLPSMA